MSFFLSPPIRAVVRVGLGVLSGADPPAESGPCSVAILARWCGRLGVPGGLWRG
jgi:hypothetical protein